MLKLALLSLEGQLQFLLMKSLSQLQASPACLYRGLSACPAQIKVCHFVSCGVGEQELHNSSTERERSHPSCLQENQISGKSRERSMSALTSFPVFDLGCLIPDSMWKGHHSFSVLGLAPKQGALGLGSWG